MSALQVGSTTAVPELPGRWSVWSASGEAPGAHFVVPVDDEAKALGVKFASIRVTVLRGSHEPRIELLRTDPAIPGLGR